MHIELVTDEMNRPASELASAILREGSAGRTDVSFSVGSYADRSAHAEVFLLMGYDARPSEIKRSSAKSFVGIIDPRPRQKLAFEDVDFLLPNGFESWQQWRPFNRPQEYLYLNELVAIESGSNRVGEGGSDPIRFGYLGNAVHLKRLKEVASASLREWTTRLPLEVWLYLSSQVEEKDWDWLPVKPRVFSLGGDSLSEFLRGVDVGLVPQNKPTSNSDRVARLLRRFGSDRDNVVDLSFKPTTNPGRLFSFAQVGIPVVVDSTPSVNQIVGSEFREFIAFDGKSWSCAINEVIQRPTERRMFGQALKSIYLEVAQPTVQVDRLLKLVRTGLGVASGGRD